MADRQLRNYGECGVQSSAFRVQSLSKICVLRATKSRLTKKGSARYRANVRITVLPDLINLALWYKPRLQEYYVPTLA
jgi:hypothetical protein